jgi:hypothetical protein
VEHGARKIGEREMGVARFAPMLSDTGCRRGMRDAELRPDASRMQGAEEESGMLDKLLRCEMDAAMRNDEGPD